jgi:hypothetical protein
LVFYTIDFIVQVLRYSKNADKSASRLQYTFQKNMELQAYISDDFLKNTGENLWDYSKGWKL